MGIKSASQCDPQVGHTDFVTALAYGPPGSLAEEALIVSGSRDASVRIWSVDSAQEVGPPLLGHKYQVTAVAVLPASSSARATQPLVVSASLDATLRVWDTTGACLRVLTGHTGPVLACLAVGETVWSGSGDGTIRVWDPDSGECLRILQAHGDSVRCGDSGCQVGTCMPVVLCDIAGAWHGAFGLVHFSSTLHHPTGA